MARPQQRGFERGGRGVQAGATVEHAELAVEVLVDLYRGMGITAPLLGAVLLLIGEHLEAAVAKGHRVVGGHGAAILEAAQMLQRQACGVQRAEGTAGQRRGHGELGIEARQIGR